MRPGRAALASLARLAAAAAAGWLLPRFLPLAPGDPLRGTLALLPFLAVAAREIALLVERQGGGRLAPRASAGELAALGLLALLALARPHLELDRAEEVLAAGFLLLLAHRLARQLRAARPLLGTALPDRPSIVFFLLPLLAYLAILPWSARQRPPDGDEPYYLLITHSLAYDLDAELTDDYAQGEWRHFLDRPLAPQPGDPVGPRGELYSRHNELLPMALAPAYRLAGKAGALATMAALSAALAWVVLRLARHYARATPGEALAAYALAAFAPPLLLYSHQVWVEVPGALLVVLALDRILALRGRQETWGWKQWLGIGLPLLLLPLLKIRFMLLAAPLFVLGWWQAGRPRKPLLILGLLLAALALGILAYNSALYSNPLKIHTWQEIDPHNYSLTSYALGFLGLFWDAAFGLFACAPLWLLLVPAALLLLARRGPVLLHLAVLALPYLLIVAPRREWYGGWSPPFRYPLVVLPLLALALVPLLARRERLGARALLAALGALTLVLTLVWVAVPGWTYNFADGRSYLLDLLGERLGADLARLFPSSVRPRPATWIWPLATLLLAPLLWWLPGRGSRTAPLWGIAALLLAAAALPLAAARLPTRVVEMEDPQVRKSGGHLHPDRWVVDRTRYRGGWALRVGETLTAPVRPASGRVRITLHAELIRNQPVPYSLDVCAGDRLLAVWTPRRQRVWEAIPLGPFDWPEGAPLVLRAHGPHPPGHLNGALLDRAVLEWL